MNHVPKITLGESTVSVALPSGTFKVTEIFNEEFDTYFKDNLEDVAELVNILLLLSAHGTKLCNAVHIPVASVK